MPDPSPTAVATHAWEKPTLHRSRHAGPGRRARRAPLDYLLPVHLGQVVVWQLAALAAIGWFRPVGTRTVVVLALGGLAVLASSVRVGGRCGYEWLATWLTYRRARETAPLPELDLRTHTDRVGNRTGLAGLGGSWSAAIRLRAAGDVDPAGLVAVLGDYFRGGEIRLAAAQLAIRTTGTDRAYWVAVRYDPEQGPQAARARGGGELGALRTTASAAYRLARLLDDAGYPGRVLDERELADQLARAAGDGPAHEAHETWRDWTVADVRHRCYRPSYGSDPAAMLDRTATGAAATWVSYTLRRRPRGAVGAEVLVRVVDGEPRDLGVVLDRLDGRHAAASRATLPLALATRVR
jgi:type VII secretion protein EccE